MALMNHTTRSEKGKKYTHIVQAALIVFSQYGLTGASMDQIAAQAQMSKSNIFYYFSSKEELYLAALSKVLADWVTPFDQLTVDKDPYTALAEYIQDKLQHSRKFPEASRLFALEMIQGAPHIKSILKGSFKKIFKEKIRVIDQWIAEGKLTQTDSTHLIFSIWALTQHYADFSVQIEALTGKTLSNKVFFAQTTAAVQHILLSGLIPQGIPSIASESVALDETGSVQDEA